MSSVIVIGLTVSTSLIHYKIEIAAAVQGYRQTLRERTYVIYLLYRYIIFLGMKNIAHITPDKIDLEIVYTHIALISAFTLS
jgi:hypothetical protein